MTRHTPLWLQEGDYAASIDRRLIGALWPTGRCDGCAVGISGSGGMDVAVQPGSVAVPTPNSTGTTLCYSDAVEVVPIEAAPAAGTDRIDLIVCAPGGADLNGAAPGFTFAVVKGTDAPTGTAVPPAQPAGTVALARVGVVGGSVAVDAVQIIDMRPFTLAVPEPTPTFTPVHFRCVHSTQSIPRVAWTNVTAWNAPTENIGGGAWANGTYTIPITGRYFISGSLIFAIPTTTGWVAAQMQIAAPGGSPVPQDIRGWRDPQGFNAGLGAVVSQRQLTAGNIVYMQAYNGHPSAAMSLFGNYLGLEIHRVG